MLALTLAFALGAHLVLAATDHFGQVVFNGSPVPGAMVTASFCPALSMNGWASPAN